MRDAGSSMFLGTTALQMTQSDRGKWEYACQAYLIPLAKAVSFKDPWKLGQEVMLPMALPGESGCPLVGEQPLLANEPIGGTSTPWYRRPQPPSSHFSLINLKKGIKFIRAQGGGSLGPPSPPWGSQPPSPQACHLQGHPSGRFLN